jgi:Late competence development protein ComFB
MPAEFDFDSVRNHHERAVFAAVTAGAERFAHLRDAGLLPDVACVALNRIAPRYIRHEVDFAFYLNDKERAANERMVEDAVAFAFEFVQARAAMRARA